MNMKTTLWLLLRDHCRPRLASVGLPLFFCVAAFGQPGTNASLLQNGGFENNGFVQDFATVPDSDLDGAATLEGWVAGGANSTVRPDLYRDGSYYSATGGAADAADRFFVGCYGPHADYVEQSFSTTVGAGYIVTFQQSQGAVFDSSL